MDSKFAPWRIDWVTREERNEEFDGCVFCRLPEQGKDAYHRVLARGDHSYIVLNKSPYNPGHVMVIPFAHIESIVDPDEEVLLDLFSLLQKSIAAISETYHPDGFNMGANIGRAAGASVEDHFHLHLIPRWYSDTTFMPLTANTKIIVQALDESYCQLHNSFAQMDGVENRGADKAVSVETALNR